MPVALETYHLLQQLLAHTPDIVFFKDRQSRYLEFNDALLNLVGVPREIVLGSDTSNFLPRELTAQIIAQDQQVMNSKLPIRTEQWVEFADGRMALMDTIIAPIVDHAGAVVGLLGIGRDITELMNTSLALKEKNLALEKANRELDILMHHAAHDLRAPLASIMSLIDIMRQEEDPAQLKQWLDMQAEKINRLDGFVQDIVNLSKNNRQEIVTDNIDLEQLFFSVVDQFRFLPGAAGMQFDCSVTGFPTLRSDRFRLEMVLNNLVSNAVRYSDPKKASRHLRLTAHIQTDKAILRLEDNGLGIAEEHIEHIFEMFYRAHKHNKGSGIGLYITRETLLKIGGAITVSSTLGVGTAFILEIPNLLQPS
jgi:PAS domain S-box-containing protein